MKKVLNNYGEGYIDTVVSIICAIMVIVLALNVFAFFTLKQDLDYFAKQMIACATMYGRTTNEVERRYLELCEETGISPTYDFSESEYFNSSFGRVQLGETVVLTVSYQTNIQGFGALSLPATITAKHSGLSQKYWKG